MEEDGNVGAAAVVSAALFGAHLASRATAEGGRVATGASSFSDGGFSARQEWQGGDREKGWKVDPINFSALNELRFFVLFQLVKSARELEIPKVGQNGVNMGKEKL